MQDPNKIRDARKRERESMDQNERQVRAIEDLADTLEAIRIDLIAWRNQPGGR